MTEIAHRIHEHWNEQKIAKITYHLPVGDWITFFTPVAKSLAKVVTRETGVLLHYLSAENVGDDRWWNTKRQKIREAYRLAWVACRGEHLAMPLWNRRTHKPHPLAIVVSESDSDKLRCLVSLQQDNACVSFSLEYLESPPAEWICDLD